MGHPCPKKRPVSIEISVDGVKSELLYRLSVVFYLKHVRDLGPVSTC